MEVDAVITASGRLRQEERVQDESWVHETLSENERGGMVGGLKGFAGHKLGREIKEIDEQEAEKKKKGKAGCSGLHGFLRGFPMRGSLRLLVRDSEEEKALVSAQRIFALRLPSRDGPMPS